MRDVVVILVTLAFFALCLAYIRWCDRLIGPDEAPAGESDAGEDGGVADDVTTDRPGVVA